MRRFCLVLFGLFLCIDSVDAVARVQTTQTTAVRQQRTKPDTSSTRSVSSRSAVTSDIIRKTTARSATNKTITGRNATRKKTTTRAATQTPYVSRAAATVQTKTFGNNYNSCRDAYFTCMDQFCATQNETYRRCVCSSKLKDIQKQEKLLSQTSDSLKDFEELNIDVISKTSKEVTAMLSASEGESAIKKDSSNSANTLKNISGVLSSSKTKSLSTQGSLDIAGDIKSIWTTTNLIGGTDIANLTGEALFNAVHAQCSEMVAPSCVDSDLKMVASAYGMYIENDCSLLEANLKTKTTTANAAIRTSRHKMQDARLENYDAHNSSSINDCIANVRNNITADSACGKGYIHCLDFSGKYLNASTGEPIYSPEFYQIENQISLSGDILNNNKNSTVVNMMNKKRSFATKSLDLCRDDADYVWDEFLRQAIVEIYQGQQQRVKKVKDECLQVVNECYLKQSDSLKSFSGDNSKINLGQTLELSEEMCADKLNTCGNLYGGGTKGMNTLIETMTGITDATIEQSCPEMLNAFVNNICAVNSDDSVHSYPYGCRKYAPGESSYANNEICNQNKINPFSKSDILVTGIKEQDFSVYTSYCSVNSTKIYKSCKYGYYLYSNKIDENTECSPTTANPYCFNDTSALECRTCPTTAVCPGGTSRPVDIDNNLYFQCGEYYIGSLYQKLVIFALENCRRPSADGSYTISEYLLSEINNVMNKLRSELIKELSTECSNQSGTWVDIPWTDKNGDGLHDLTGDTLLTQFYLTTGTNALWGYCKR